MLSTEEQKANRNNRMRELEIAAASGDFTKYQGEYRGPKHGQVCFIGLCQAVFLDSEENDDEALEFIDDNYEAERVWHGGMWSSLSMFVIDINDNSNMTFPQIVETVEHFIQYSEIEEEI